MKIKLCLLKHFICSIFIKVSDVVNGPALGDINVVNGPALVDIMLSMDLLKETFCFTWIETHYSAYEKYNVLFTFLVGHY